MHRSLSITDLKGRKHVLLLGNTRQALTPAVSGFAVFVTPAIFCIEGPVVDDRSRTLSSPSIRPFQKQRKFLLGFSQAPSFSFFCLSSCCWHWVIENKVPLRFPSFTTMSSLEKQFEEFRSQLEESGTFREKIRSVVMEIESTARLLHSNLLTVHQSRPLPEVLEKARSHIATLKDLYEKLSEVFRECPGQYYRYHGDWRSETQNVVFLVTFMHWLETGDLILHDEAANLLGLNSPEFGLDLEDYLIGVCFMSNELPRYVVNQVTSGDYDCPRKVLNFLTDLNASFRILNLRNDFLRKKFDSLKYDLRRVEEVFYDVKIRGLSAKGDSEGDVPKQSNDTH
ncbi:hypothetical protein MLD38_015894 [Melastoma candidum]|uniref:Uncharacterized protein n=1 Tax=Melastoma candidum TaxID=119954 RepID=A0ACB9RIU5_9MYRT|nr:hypothetical protein MLD38_015894 [Melastoma candidum]